MRIKNLISFLSLVVGCGGMPDSGLGEASQSIIGGTTDTADPAVMVLLAIPKPNSSSAYLCTVSLISPIVLLTAAHCVSPQVVGNTATFRVYQNDDLNTRPSRWLNVKETRYDTQFNVNNLTAGHDIGVVILSTPLKGVTPLPYNTSALARNVIGGSIRLVGYGSNNGKSGGGVGTKRQTTTVVDALNDALVQIGNSQKQTCSGDSGGPALMRISGVETIVGVTSFGYEGCVYGGFDTRVDVYKNFINAYVRPTAAASLINSYFIR